MVYVLCVYIFYQDLHIFLWRLFTSTVYTPIHKSPGSLLSRLHGPYFLPTSLLPLSSLELLLIDSLEGKGKQDFKISKKFIYENKILARELLDFITEKTASHLINQAKSGADILKLFDSWSGVLAEEEFTEFVIEPTKKIVSRVKEIFPNVPIIAFPKGVGLLYEKFIKEVPIDVLALDQTVPLEKMRQWSDKVIVQGNLDPIILLTNKEIIKEKAYKILSAMKGKNFIFNLGHGILPETPPENVEFLTEYVRSFNE